MAKTVSAQLRKDKRIKKAKQLLKSVLTDYQKELTNSKSANSKLKKGYEKLIARCSELRGGKLYYPYLSSGLGKGALVELADGSVKYDFITGIGVHYLGHNHPRLLEAAVEAALEDTIIQGNLQQGAVTMDLLETIVSAVCKNGAKLEHCFLTSSGAMANENALKMIFQKHHPASRFLAFKRCFAGRTMVMAQITDKPEHREGLPKVLEVDYIPFFDPKSPQESINKAVNCLNGYLQRYPSQYAGMCFELIQGEGGYYPGNQNFFVALMDILKVKKIAIMIDEIQTFGRTSELFAFQYFQLDKYVDVVTIGKLTQVCATLFTDVYKPKSGLISQTFTASSAAIYAARAILKELLTGGYLGKNGKIIKQSKHFVRRLQEFAHRYPNYLQGPFGMGAMIGCTVFDGSEEINKIFLKELFEAGVVAFNAGHSPTRVRFLMPIGAVTFKDIDNVCKIIEKTLTKVADQINLKNRGH